MQSMHFAAPADWITRKLFRGVLPLCKDSIRAFSSPSRLGHLDTRWGVSYFSTEMQSVYSAAPADWITRKLFRGVLPLCKDSIRAFCSPSRLGHQVTRWGGSYCSAEMQSMHSALADWASRALVGGGGLTSLQTLVSRGLTLCWESIVQPLPTGQLWNLLTWEGWYAMKKVLYIVSISNTHC